jgi:AraC family transcriptional regulator
MPSPAIAPAAPFQGVPANRNSGQAERNPRGAEKISGRLASPPESAFGIDPSRAVHAPMKPPAKPASPHEAPAWSGIDGVWQPVYGSFREQGLSIEWHEFSNAKGLDWARSFHPESLEVCLNFSGQAALQLGKVSRALGPEQTAFYTTAGDRFVAERRPGHLHRFFTLELSVAFLRAQLGAVLDGLRGDVRRFIEQPGKARPIVHIAPMAPALLACRIHLLEPPVHAAGHAIWYQSKAVEILTHLLFEPDTTADLFCRRHLRQNRERVERVLFLLERDLENPPSLEMLAKEVGCSPFYLSRVFAQETGGSIPKYLRQKRIEKAAEYLRTGKMNVTEAAMAVGYSSLSSFNKAFVEHWGCCPGLYPHAKNLVRRTL